jgi:ABC-type cobalamin/Fe3+-siderophores transport system ATPase subunit
MTSILSANGLTVVRGRRRILEAASLTLMPGALTAIVGPNGSGKSTLLRTLAGIWQPVSGSVTLDGRPVAGLSRRDIARQLSFLPQDTRCDFAFTVDEIVTMGRYPHRGRFTPQAKRDRDAIDEAIATCDLQDLRSRTLDRLSGGERQRVAIARCLAAEPSILLLDEPTAHLDVEHALTVLTVCRRLATAGATVVVAMHDLATALRAADRAVLMHCGRIVASGPARDILTPSHCREVFAVDAEVLTTTDGRPALVFSALSTSVSHQSQVTTPQPIRRSVPLAEPTAGAYE